MTTSRSSFKLDSSDLPKEQLTAKLLRIRFLSDPEGKKAFVLDEVRVIGPPIGGGESRNWALLEEDALARASDTYGPRRNRVDTDRSAGILQLAARAALYFRQNDPKYARELFQRCRRPALWILRRGWDPNPDKGLHLHRIHFKPGTRNGRAVGWVGYDGRVLEGLGWYCAAYPVFNAGQKPPAELFSAVEACRDRILAVLATHQDEYWHEVSHEMPGLSQKYIAGGLESCAEAERASGLEERAGETIAAVRRMIKKMASGSPLNSGNLPHRPRDSSGDTGPHFFYTIVDYLQIVDEPDTFARDYIRLMPDFIWQRCLDNSMLREAGHRAAVPSVALWSSPEHIEAVQSSNRKGE